jgi:hypothetical protein
LPHEASADTSARFDENKKGELSLTLDLLSLLHPRIADLAGNPFSPPIRILTKCRIVARSAGEV